MKYLFGLQPENIFFFSGLGWHGKQVVWSYTTIITGLVCQCGTLVFPWPALCPVCVVPFLAVLGGWLGDWSVLERWLRRFSLWEWQASCSESCTAVSQTPKLDRHGRKSKESEHRGASLLFPTDSSLFKPPAPGSKISRSECKKINKCNFIVQTI